MQIYFIIILTVDIFYCKLYNINVLVISLYDYRNIHLINGKIIEIKKSKIIIKYFKIKRGQTYEKNCCDSRQT